MVSSVPEEVKQAAIDASLRKAVALLAGGEVGRVRSLPATDNNGALMRLIAQAHEGAPAPFVTIDVWDVVASDVFTDRHPIVDVLLGFQSLEAADDLSVEVRVANHVSFAPMRVSPGGFVFAMRDRHAIPFISMRFNPVSVRVRPAGAKYAMIGMVLDTFERRVMAQSRLEADLCGAGPATDPAATPGRYSVCESGMMTMTDERPPPPDLTTMYGCIRLLDLRTEMDELDNAAQRARTLSRLEDVRRELMAAAWHPRRLREWCLEHDDEFAKTASEVVSRTRPEDDDEDAPPVVFEAFLTREECSSVAAMIVAGVAEVRDTSPRLVCDAGGAVRAAVQERLRERSGLPWRVCGDRVAFGDSSAGMHAHRDEPLQGGTRTLLVYLDDVEAGGGGCTVFEDGDVHIQPVAGRAVLFGVRRMHAVTPCRSAGRPKRVLACEVSLS